MKEFRYTLDRSSKKHICPSCGKRSFVRYLDTATGRYLADDCGRCDREQKCGYHYPPSEYFHDNGMIPNHHVWQPRIVSTPRPSYISAEVFKRSLARWEQNNLITYLRNVMGDDQTRQAIERYYIGTSRHWAGSTIFWQIDAAGRVHTGKVMLYNPSTGKRVKQPYNHVTWAHTVMKLPGYHLRQCLFGEHLLNTDKHKPVIVLESEKSAIIFSAVFPDYVAVACGGCGNLNASICAPLKGRDVVLCPDNGKFDEWSGKARDLRHICKSVKVSTYMEQHAKEQGDDIADIIADYFDAYNRIRETPP